MGDGGGPRMFASATDLVATAGEELGPGDWFTVTQDVIDRFADATGDHQWIHVDPERAAREAPGGTTIAHGMLTFSLLGTLQPSVYQVAAQSILNVGANRLRFLSPVPVDSRIRLREGVVDGQETAAGLRVTSSVTIEIEGAPKPAMVAEIVFLYRDDVA
ncbi:3-hydroxyacyl-thioester dehydratase HtdZ [Pseudonocardia halophobica]|uniref:Enoyl-CoA hydratase 1 n=1 Tax=Pseudonocardia halophobica TaxID=29401 RepID=A0A9W6NUN8_9PSEU|nr:MaoC family dehydratase [Pseudonocardia halophobica]GLL09793.1 putative enoyl-CoA hydratase 1 [Pseudonocardia halophobica]